MNKNKKGKSKNKTKRKYKRKYTKKILHGGVTGPFSEISGIFGNISNSFQNMVNNVFLPPTSSYNPLLPIDSSVSKQFINNIPTKSLSETINA